MSSALNMWSAVMRPSGAFLMLCIYRYLKPDENKKSKHKTAVKKKTLNPEFNEVQSLSFSLSLYHSLCLSLCLSLCCLSVSVCLSCWSLTCLVFLSLSLSNCHSHCFRDEYFRMKVQWKSVSEEQEMRNSLLRGYRSLIGLFWIPLLLIGLFMLVLQWSVWFFLCFELGRAGRKSDR